MPRVLGVIQAHPARAEMAERLAVECGGAVVIYDPDPDTAPRSAWRCYRAVLDYAVTRAAHITHVCVLQDDVTLCRNFTAAMNAAVAARPDRLIALFVAGQPHDHVQAVWAAAERDEPWARLPNDRWFPVVAAVWPIELVPALITYVEGQTWPANFKADDEIVGRFLRSAKLDALATVPSLVQHEDMVPSLLGKRSRGGNDPSRVACCWVGDCDPLTIDWTTGPT